MGSTLVIMPQRIGRQVEPEVLPRLLSHGRSPRYFSAQLLPTRLRSQLWFSRSQSWRSWLDIFRHEEPRTSTRWLRSVTTEERVRS